MQLNMQRSNEEYMVMTLAFGGVIAILPFAVIRFSHGEWLVGLVDSMLVVGMALLGSYVFVTHKVKLASLVLTIFALTGMTTIVYLKGPGVVYWAYPTMVGVYFILAPRLAIKLTLLTALVMIPALHNRMEIISFMAVGITLVVNNLFAYIFAKRMQHQQDQLTMLVRSDSLTGAGNRRAMNEKLDEIVTANKRTKRISSLVVLDVDFFKRINDNYGHAIGDQVLVNLVKLIKTRIRETDCLYRFGGEEFVLVLSGAGQGEAVKIAETYRLMIESSVLIEDMVVTISLGVAEIFGGESASDWMERADRAMYEAKETGRNRTCVAAE